MRDLDSAVGRLDNLFMSLYVVVAILIIAVTLVGILFFVLNCHGPNFLYRKPNLPPWSPRLAPWFSVRCVSHIFTYEYPDVPLYPDRTELAHWFEFTRYSHIYHLFVHTAPVRRWG